MSLRWNPDDPRWLSVRPDVHPVDLQVLRQVGIPEPILLLAIRRGGTQRMDFAGARELGSGIGYRVRTDLSFLDELVEDPDERPYTWDIPEEC